MTRSKVVEDDLFLDNKEKYRVKDVKEAAGIIENILHGKTEKVEGETLREIKMKRVEGYLKDRLCVSTEDVEDPVIKRGDDEETYEVNNVFNVLKLQSFKEKKTNLNPIDAKAVPLASASPVEMNTDDSNGPSGEVPIL